jgi:hypothetical protein
MTKLHPVVMLLACILNIERAAAQDNAGRTEQYISLPGRFLERVNEKASRLEDNILNKTNKALIQLSKEEARLKKKVSRKDPARASQLFQDATLQYSNLQQKITNKACLTKGKAYIPFLDTLTTSLHFFERNAAFLNSSSVQQSLLRIDKMKSRFQQANEIQQYLQNRRNQLRDQLGKLNMLKELKQYNKKLYYYQAQIEEYRNLIKQPDKFQRKAIDILSKTKPFQDFMAKHSMLASIFPGNNNVNLLASQPGWPGLQTSSQVNELIQQTVAGGPNSLQALQSSMQQAQAQMQQLKNKVSAVGQGEGEVDMPNFKPNNQRVKSFWNRWELGANLQSTRSNEWLPSATQFGLSAGYKLNDRSVIGVGMAGIVGWGKSIRHIVASYEGVGARSFFDWKLKASFWLVAGYEMNYRRQLQELQITSPTGGGRVGALQQSGLVGVSKRYKVGKKMKGNMSLLWDYLSYSQIPRTQPIIFRFGYSLK